MLDQDKLMTSRRFKDDDLWRPFYRTALLLALVFTAGCVATPSGALSPSRDTLALRNELP